ncbi:MAG: transcriptional regulator [Desulfovibrionaceae bacterium]|nr:transcriptional regulator [Desulfovibrionaceae bacterium]
MAETNPSQRDVLNQMESHTPESLHPVLEAAFKYRKQLIAVVGVIVAAAAIYAGVTMYTSKAVTSAQAELGAILVEARGADRLARLEALAGNVPGSVEPAVNLAIAETAMTTGDYAKSVEYWSKVADEASGDTRLVAEMGKAKALLLSGKAAEALSALKTLADGAAEAYEVPLNRQIAVAAEAAGDKAAALAAYKKLSEKNVNDKPFVDHKIAQLEAE